MVRTLLVLAISFAALGATASKPAAINDASVEANIRAKFAKSRINEEHFKVTVKSGVALLEGRTSIPQRKGVATRLARTGGAREVVNKIEVSEAARRQMAERLQKARDKKAATPRPAAVSRSAGAPTTVRPTGPATASPDTPPLRRMQIKR